MSDPAGEAAPSPEPAAVAGDDGATGTDADDPPTGVTDRVAARLEGLPGPLADPTTAAVLAVTLAGLLVRTVGLGGRIFHWDEGRVGYWILRFDATGEFFYRPIIHGPFLPVVNNALFDVLGASDFAARLPVAVVGALLPLVALPLGSRLRPREQVALALLLAFDPLLVYYARFMRGDVLVGSFLVGAFALTVHALDSRRAFPLVPAAVLVGLGFAAKENALVYLLCFAGAGALLLDHRLVRTARRTGSPLDALVAEAVALARFLGDWTADSRTRRALRRAAADGDTDAPYAPEAGYLGHLLVWVPLGALGVAAAFVGTVAFFYAPRPDLWNVLGLGAAVTGGATPDATLASVWYEATLGSADRFAGSWLSGRHSGHPYVPYLHDLVETMGYGSGVLVVLAVVGFLADGYGEATGTRPLVAFATYWGVASLLGYPVATDIQAPWAAVHVVLPLAIPAAVGAGHVADSLRTALGRGDLAGAALAGLVVLAAVSGVAAANADYYNSASLEDKQIIQWAQPENAYKETLADVALVARHHEGTDVLWIGTESPGGNTRFYVADESSLDRMPPGGPSWHSRLPTPWYLERHDVAVNSTPPEARYDGLPAEMPPVVIAKPWDRQAVANRLDGYEVRTHDFRLWGETVVVFIDESALREARAAERDDE